MVTMGNFRDRFVRKKGSEWVDWLSDERPPEEVVATVHRPASTPVNDDRRERLRRAGMPQESVPIRQAQKPGSEPTVSIQISLPEFHMPKIRIPWKQVRYWSVLALAIIGLSIGVRALVGLVPHHKNPDVAVKGAQTDKPSFKPVVPEDKKDLAQTGSSSTAYDPNRQLYSYSDKYLNGTITVSEQPVPDKFKQDPGSLAQVAATIGAKDKFETAFGTAYVATSANGTSQRVVFIRQNLLIFMESTKKYDNDAWKIYIESLR